MEPGPHTCHASTVPLSHIPSPRVISLGKLLERKFIQSKEMDIGKALIHVMKLLSYLLSRQLKQAT
jgi:hypothetical protein